MTLQSGPFSVHANMIGMAKHRRETNRRRETGHRLLFYISQGTSSKYPDWRNATINFLWDLYEIRDKNPAISVVVHKVDGITIYHDATPIAFFHLRQRHFLVHAAHGWLLWSRDRRPFSNIHKGRWPLTWKCNQESELKSFLRIVRALPVVKPKMETSEGGRYIPREVREFVLERDANRCRALVDGMRCRATTNLHFDHRLPYSRGGDSVDPKNIQILCRLHNLQKGSSLRF